MKPIMLICLLMGLIPKLWGASSIPKGDLEQVRERARNVLMVHCGSCHTPGRLTTNQDALQVFNLQERVWESRLSKKQLVEAQWRLNERATMTKDEIRALSPRGSKPPPRPSHRDLDTFNGFVSERLLSTRLGTL